MVLELEEYTIFSIYYYVIRAHLHIEIDVYNLFVLYYWQVLITKSSFYATFKFKKKLLELTVFVRKQATVVCSLMGHKKLLLKKQITGFYFPDINR